MKAFYRKIIISVLLVSFLITSLWTAAPAALAQEDLFIDAESAILADGTSGQILYQKNADALLQPASMTKMMTEYLLMEEVKKGKIKWNQNVPISDYAFKISQDRTYSNVPLLKEGKYTVKELFEAAAIYSANGAAIALAELIGGSESNFVKMMNDKAKKLGLKNYKFVNSTGLNNNNLKGMHPEGTGEDEVNLISARSAAILAFRLINDYPQVLETSKIDKKSFPVEEGKTMEMANWNWMLPGLVFGYEGVDGLKTGSTEEAGYSFTGTAKRKGLRLISVVMKADSYNSRFAETKKLLDYGFNQFTKKELLPAGASIKGKEELPVFKGKRKTVPVGAEKPLVVLVKRGEENLYQPVYKLNKWLFTGDGELRPPLKKGHSVGAVTVQYKGKDAGYLAQEGVNLVVKEDVKKASFIRLFFRSIIKFFADLF